MKMKLQKLLAIVALCCLMLTLCGCGASGSTAAPAPEATPAPAAEAPAAETAPAEEAAAVPAEEEPSVEQILDELEGEEREAAEEVLFFLEGYPTSRIGTIIAYMDDYPEEMLASVLDFLEEKGVIDWREQALMAAEDGLGAGYSREGLIEYLIDLYRFSPKDAEAAVASLEADGKTDWMNAACKSAERLINRDAFSREGLVKHLVGISLFTEEQAAAGLAYLEDNGLVDWKEQAVKSAESYLKYTPDMPRDRLYGILTSEFGNGEWFTPEEAEYALSQLGM